MTWRHVLRLTLVGASVSQVVTSPLPAEPPAIVRLTTDGHFKQRPAWSPDGSTLVFARHQGASIFLFLKSAGSGEERRLTKRDAPEFDAVWSPDGRRLAFAFDKMVPNQGDMDVYTVNSEGDDLQPVAVTAGKLSHEEWPHWSPDGQWIAFSSTREGNQEIYVSHPDGKELQRLTHDPALDAHPAWSPDGKRLALATSRWGDLEIAIMNADGSGLTRLTTSPGLDDYPTWSPNGTRLAFTSNRDGNLEIYSVSADGTDARNLSNNPAIDNFATWSRDGDLTFVSNRDGGFDIYTLLKPAR